MLTTEQILPAYRPQYDDLVDSLDQIETEETDTLSRSKRSEDIARRAVASLRAKIEHETFSSMEEEIQFFKFTKPSFFTPLIYHHEVYQLEVNRPIGSLQVQQDYFNHESQKLKIFFDDHAPFFKYYRSGSTSLDNIYFTRGHLHEVDSLDPIFLQADPQFSTAYDFVLAKAQANTMLSDYVNRSIYELSHPTFNTNTLASSSIKWTSAIIDLAELIYGLIADGAVNNGRVPARTLAAAFSTLFNIKIDFISKKFEEIRLRKKNRTVFWDRGKRSLIRKIEEDDEHAL